MEWWGVLLIVLVCIIVLVILIVTGVVSWIKYDYDSRPVSYKVRTYAGPSVISWANVPEGFIGPVKITKIKTTRKSRVSSRTKG
jgi:hypothetical protein